MASEGLRVSPAWVVCAVVAGTLSAIGWNLTHPTESHQWLIYSRVAITFITGLWYAFRYYCTLKSASHPPGFLSTIFMAVLAVSGLSGFLLVSTYAWGWVLAGVLLLSVLKRIEMVLHQKRQVAVMRSSPLTVSVSRMRVARHWYSTLRDVSQAFWWAIYSFLDKFSDDRITLVVSFGVPYVLLVFGWGLLKQKVEVAEDDLNRKVDQLKPTSSEEDGKKIIVPE